MKEVLSQKNVRYAFIDVCESVGKLKLFFKLRDTEPVLEAAREAHRVGIPTLVVDGQVIPVDDAEHMERLIDELDLAAEE